MSLIHFLATSDRPLTVVKYEYKNIFQCEKQQNMFFDGEISFTNKLSSAEESTILDIFSNWNTYAIHTTCGLNYETKFIEGLSKNTAHCMFQELEWFKNFIKKLLKSNDEIFVLKLNLGYPTNKFKLKTKQVDINNWVLNENDNFEFDYGIVYQFVDSSKNSFL